MPMMLRDAARLDPKTVQVWNGARWAQVLRWSRSARNADELETVLRSGERISCSPTHKFLTGRGALAASDLEIGDALERCRLAEPAIPRDSEHIGPDAAWLAGLYIAEGSRSEDTIQIAGNAKEEERWNHLQTVAKAYGGYATRTLRGNTMDIRLYGKVLSSLLAELVSGRTARDKCLAPVCWRYSNRFLRSLLEGYLSGDGHWDAQNNRWRLGFTRNYNLERDLRTLAARMGVHLVLKLCSVPHKGTNRPAFRGEVRFEVSQHHNRKSSEEIIKIAKARCREIYDIAIGEGPQLFSLASGILTHTSRVAPT